MIRATMDWNRLRMEAAGHAGYAEEGKDIVCAGASTITGALAMVLQEAEDRGRCSVRVRQREAYGMIQADPAMGNVQEVKAYFRMAVKGLQMLQEEYPKHVQIREVM